VIEIVSFKKLSQISQSSLQLIGELQYTEGLLKKTSDNKWNCIAYSNAVDKKSSQLQVTIKNTNKDLSGLIIGLQNSSYLDETMKNIKEHAIALNGKGYTYN